MSTHLYPYTEIPQYLRKTKTTSTNSNTTPYGLAIDNLHTVLRLSEENVTSHQFSPETSPQSTSQVFEVTGSDTVIALHVLFNLAFDIP